MHKFLANTVFLGKDIIYLTDCHSTNDEAMDRIKSRKVDEGSIIITDNQIKGKGQRGSQWHSEAGKNLIFSLVLRPGFLDPGKQFYLNMVISLSVMELLHDYGFPAKIKWPNDLRHETDGKVCGILIENIIHQKSLDYAIVGIGLNVNQTTFELEKVTSLKIWGVMEFDIWELFKSLVSKIEKWYLALKKGKEKEIKEIYLNHLYLFEEWSEYFDDHQFTGRIIGINEQGNLLIENEYGRTKAYGLKEIRFL